MLTNEASVNDESLKKARTELFAHQDAQKELMVMRELPQPKKAYVLTRGEYDKRAEEMGPGDSSLPFAVSKGCAKESVGLCAMAHGTGSSAHGARDSESCVDESVWSRAGEDDGGLWQSWADGLCIQSCSIIWP